MDLLNIALKHNASKYNEDHTYYDFNNCPNYFHPISINNPLFVLSYYSFENFKADIEENMFFHYKKGNAETSPLT